MINIILKVWLPVYHYWWSAYHLRHHLPSEAMIVCYYSNHQMEYHLEAGSPICIFLRPILCPEIKLHQNILFVRYWFLTKKKFPQKEIQYEIFLTSFSSIESADFSIQSKHCEIIGNTSLSTSTDLTKKFLIHLIRFSSRSWKFWSTDGESSV